MPPTIPTSTNSISGDKRSTPRPPTGERRSELVCRVKYCNTLPDIPFDPKFLAYPFESNRFIKYTATSLERNYKYEVLTEHDLGVVVDLINRDQYNDQYAQLDPADEKLLEEDTLTPHDSKRSRHHSLNVSWLRRTEYISTEQTRFQPQVMDKVEAKVGFSIKKSLKEETLFLDRDSQIKAIEKTFEDVKKPIEKHYSKPNVYPMEILPVFPDFKMWKYPCAQVIFDSDPAPIGRSVPAQIEEMSQAMIRGVMDESGEQFVAYFLPTEETLEKRRRDFTDNVEYVDEEEYDYKIAREYNWNVKTKASKGYEENYFLVFRPEEGVFFNELETRVRLNKRRQKAGQPPNNTRLVVKHRPMNEDEFRIHLGREKFLEPHEEEEEEDDDEDDDDDDDGEQKNSKHVKKDSDVESNSSVEKEKKNNSSGESSGSGKSTDDEKENDHKNNESFDSESEKQVKRRKSSTAGSSESESEKHKRKKLKRRLSSVGGSSGSEEKDDQAKNSGSESNKSSPHAESDNEKSDVESAKKSDAEEESEQEEKVKESSKKEDSGSSSESSSGSQSDGSDSN